MDSNFQQRCMELEEELERLNFSSALEKSKLQDEVISLRLSPALTVLCPLSPVVTRQGQELHGLSSE